MPGEITMLQIGQCGNQVGCQFWKRLCTEHGISPTGDCGDPIVPDSRDRKIFFYETTYGQYKPRAVLIDLEPRVINSIMAEVEHELYEDIYLSEQGSGAGNNWAVGYDHAQKHSEKILEILRNQSDGCDSLEGFMICHSIAGGTGSGVGSHLLECLSDYYPKKLIQTYSVFPEHKKTSEVVVQPYNSLLTLRRLIDLADSVVVFDNAALNKAATGKDQVENLSYTEINSLATSIMSASTSSMRFPSHSFTSLSELLAGLIKSPRLHFLTPGYATIEPENKHHETALDVLLHLYDPSSIMLSTGLEKSAKHRFISSLNILQGNICPNHRLLAIDFIKERNLAPFTTWTPAAIQVTSVGPSPYMPDDGLASAVMLASHTGISALFEILLSQYEKLKKHDAFVKQMSRVSEYDFAEDLAASCEQVHSLVEEYKAARQPNYLQWSG